MEYAIRPIGSYALEAFDTEQAYQSVLQDNQHGSLAANLQNKQPNEQANIESISRLQLRKALIYFDIFHQVEAAIAKENEDNQQSWYAIKRITRNDKLLNSMALKLEYTESQIDYIFEIAASL